ncbi:uncharacterized protein LOC115444471 [Manduca sexta]|uniref:uncharacterized protein LOC115444471 n=1 Tax=Manduca sexta TaxID=7130 RepID=UPI00188DE77D|nr:uncharacterized protein LOC115444471 [Manduca sexta]
MTTPQEYWQPYNCLAEATIYNKRNEIVPWNWIMENADVIALLFTAKGVDKDGIIEKFYGIYENVKYVNMPIEVIYVPMDECEREARSCYDEQANWFTLKLHDPLVLTLKFMHGITCIPHILVTKVDGTVVSSHGVMDLEEYGKNAVITWLSISASAKHHRRMSKDAEMYGEKWHYLGAAKKDQEYHKKYSIVEEASV